MKKIFELAGQDWMKGLSVQASFPLGGIFRQASNFNPFEKMGTMSPGSTATELGSGTITEVIRSLVSVYHSGDSASRVLAYGDDSSLYKVAPSSGTVSDISGTLASGSTTARGAIAWRNKFVYLKNTEARKFDLTGTFGANEAQLLSGLTTGVTHEPVIGADGNLYIPNGSAIARLVLETGTTGNSTSVFSIDSDLTIRQLLNDGQFLVGIADANSNNTNGLFRCVVFFWDMVSGTPERIYDLYENRVYAMEQKDSAIYVYGSDSVYVCNVSSAPKVLFPLRNSTLSEPTLPSCLKYYRNSILWARTGGSDASTGILINGYGSAYAGQKPIFFTPSFHETTSFETTAFLPFTYDTANSYYFIACAESDGSNPKLFRFYTTGSEAGATRTTASLKVSDIHLPQPYKFEYAKIVLRDPISSGQSVSFSMQAQGEGVTVSSSQTFNTVGKQTFIYYPSPAASTPEYIEEICNLSISSTKAVIERFEIWGTPVTQQQAKI